MTNVLEAIEPEDILNQLGLEHIETMNGGSCLVYRARDVDNTDLIVKLPISRKDNFDYIAYRRNSEQLVSELEALSLTAGLQGVTRLKKYIPEVRLPEDSAIFQSPHLFRGISPAIIKQYIPGNTLSDGAKIVGKENQDFVEKSVQGLYERGICLIDNIPSATVVTPNGKPIFVDLGFASIGGNVKASKHNRDRVLNLLKEYYVDN